MARSQKLILGIICLVILALAAGVVFRLQRPPKFNHWEEPKRSFSGSSDLLKQTAVVPTLDTPTVANQSIVWCISFQLAWNQLKKDSGNKPIKLSGAQTIVDHLNESKVSADDVLPSDYFAMAGRVDDGIEKQIQSGLREKFPEHNMPPIAGVPGGYIAVGYLKADIRYTYQFINNREWFTFTQGDGRKVNVRSFGLPEIKKGYPLEGSCRDQVRVLYRDGGRFAVDLSHNSAPNQIILAKVSRRDTLATIWAELNEKLDAARPKPFPKTASLLIPNCDWRIEHDYRELVGNTALNAGMEGRTLIKAFQFIDFKMDRMGAALESGALLGFDNGHEPAFDPNPDRYHFDQPFLIIMKKRDAKNPFFVMWIENAELLCKP